MNWKEIPADELLDKINDKTDRERETILNDYLCEKKDYLETEPSRLLPLLESMLQLKEQFAAE